MRIETRKTEHAMNEATFKPVWENKVFVDDDGRVMVLDDDGANSVVIEGTDAWLNRKMREFFTVEKHERMGKKIEKRAKKLGINAIKRTGEDGSRTWWFTEDGDEEGDPLLSPKSGLNDDEALSWLKSGPCSQ